MDAQERNELVHLATQTGADVETVQGHESLIDAGGVGATLALPNLLGAIMDGASGHSVMTSPPTPSASEGSVPHATEGPARMGREISRSVSATA